MYPSDSIVNEDMVFVPEKGLKITYEQPACNFCGHKEFFNYFSSDIVPWYEDKKFTLVRCKKCNLVFASPRPDDASLERIFLGQKAINDYHRKLNRDDVNEVHKSFVNDYLTIKNDAKNVFDVGCGAGTLLRHFKERGLDVHGNDINIVTYDKLREENIHVVHSATKDLDIDKKFDIITCLEYIEHTSTPFEDLKRLYSLLNDDGIFILKTMYLGCPGHIQRGEEWHLFGCAHLHYFSPDVLINMCQSAGFKILYKRAAALISIYATKKYSNRDSEYIDNIRKTLKLEKPKEQALIESNTILTEYTKSLENELSKAKSSIDNLEEKIILQEKEKIEIKQQAKICEDDNADLLERMQYLKQRNNDICTEMVKVIEENNNKNKIILKLKNNISQLEVSAIASSIAITPKPTPKPAPKPTPVSQTKVQKPVKIVSKKPLEKPKSKPKVKVTWAERTKEEKKVILRKKRQEDPYKYYADAAFPPIRLLKYFFTRKS